MQFFTVLLSGIVVPVCSVSNCVPQKTEKIVWRHQGTCAGGPGAALIFCPRKNIFSLEVIMKRKIFVAAIAAIAAVFCTFGLTACGGDDGDGIPEPTALQKAYENYRQTQNMTVTVADSRTVKHGTDFSASVKIDYAHKAAYSKHFYITKDNLDITHKITFENYYEIDDGKRAFTIYQLSGESGETAEPANRNKIDRSDLFNLPEASSDPQKFEIQLFTDFVNSYLPSHALNDTCWRESENSEQNRASLDTPELLNKFSESANGYSANVYFCINPGNGVYTPYACTVTIKLDTQDRFSKVVVDCGSNGSITANYAYGATTVTIPEEAKNANQNN